MSLWRVRVALLAIRWRIAMEFAWRTCKGNRYGKHTRGPSEPLGGRCFCNRMERRVDYIPF